MPNPGATLKPGTFARVRIETSKTDNVLTVPVAALQYRYGVNRVFVLAGDHLIARELKVGDRVGDRIEVVSGVAGGDPVVVNDVESLADGMKLMFKEDFTPKNAEKVVFMLAPFVMAIPAVTAIWWPKLRAKMTGLTLGSFRASSSMRWVEPSVEPSSTSTSSHGSPALAMTSLTRRYSSGILSNSLKMGAMCRRTAPCTCFPA